MPSGKSHRSPHQMPDADLARTIERMNAEAWALRDSDPDRSRANCYLVRTMINANQSADPAITEPGLAQSLLTLSVVDWNHSAYDHALAAAIEAQSLFIKLGDVRQHAFITNHIAGIYFYLGDYSRALNLGMEALNLSAMSEDRNLYASCLNDTAYFRLHIGQFDQALPQLAESLALHRELGSRHGETQALESLGTAHYLMGDYEQALSYEMASLAISQEIAYWRAETEALHNTGRIYAASGETALAMEYFERALAQSRERGYRQFQAAILLDQGKIALSQGQTGEAERALTEALETAQAIHARPVILDIFHALADLYEQAGDYARALAHYKQFHEVREDMLRQHNSIIMHSLETRHQLEQARSEAEIYQLRNVELQRQMEEREKLIADLDAFAHTVAHDLKNPLASVIGYAELLVLEIDEGNRAAAMEHAQTLVESGLKATQIVDDLLLLASVRKENVNVQPVDMAAVVRSVLSRMNQQIVDTNAQLTLPDEWPAALGHGPWIEQVWTNYLSNALKYGGTPPQIALGAEREGSTVRYWVRDLGEGIPQEKQARLFVQFDRLDTRMSSGHGLGLSIVKRIIENLNGMVGVESTGRPGEGCTFFFTLPAASAQIS